MDNLASKSVFVIKLACAILVLKILVGNSLNSWVVIVSVDLCNYATKNDIKNITHIDTYIS